MTPGEPLIDFGWIAGHLDDIAQRIGEHATMTVLAVGIGFVISFALALMVRNQRSLYGPIMVGADLLYSIPSLAFFALMIPFTGISILTAEIALVSYTLLVLVRNIVTAFDGVPREVIEAADGMGFSRAQRLVRIELPIALPVIVAGIRIATVTTVGLVTVTSLIGLGGLGYFIVTSGINRFFPTSIFVGVAASVGMAVVADAGLLLLQRALTPWARARAASG
jgi:osmoprotectant transport system permease protein